MTTCDGKISRGIPYKLQTARPPWLLEAAAHTPLSRLTTILPTWRPH